MIMPGCMIPSLIISGAIDLNTQIQPAGIDLTVKRISTYEGEGSLDFSNEERKLPLTKWLEWEDYGGTIRRLDKLFLPTGAYLVEADPIIEIPMDMIAFAQPRSSLTRMGCGIHSGIWDPGYKGDSVFVLNVYNPHGMTIHRNARIAQLVYIRMENEASEGYSGDYQGHGIHDNDAPPGLSGKGW